MTGNVDLFGETPAPGRRLRDPVLVTCVVQSQTDLAVLLDHNRDIATRFCPKSLCEFDGFGQQEIAIERFKAKEFEWPFDEVPRDG